VGDARIAAGNFAAGGGAFERGKPCRVSTLLFLASLLRAVTRINP
jgi:hypothetical protein